MGVGSIGNPGYVLRVPSRDTAGPVGISIDAGTPAMRAYSTVFAARSDPYRETHDAIDVAVEADVVCVEMKAAALHACAAARNRNVVCFAHFTNTMALTDNDFEEGRRQWSPRRACDH